MRCSVLFLIWLNIELNAEQNNDGTPRLYRLQKVILGIRKHRRDVVQTFFQGVIYITIYLLIVKWLNLRFGKNYWKYTQFPIFNFESTYVFPKHRVSCSTFLGIFKLRNTFFPFKWTYLFNFKQIPIQTKTFNTLLSNIHIIQITN